MFEQNEDLYMTMKAGDRVRFVNVVPSATSAHQQDGQLSLNFLKTSKLFHYTDAVLKPRKMADQIESNKTLIEKSISLADFKRKFN
jgi:hypothetical protein